MPTTVTYPGVYIEELPSGVHSITGVSTSITAFAGWAPKGPTDRAQLVLSWTDFTRYFGGMDARSLLGFSVYHFFANGGTQAYIIRLASGEVAAKATIDGVLAITAKNGGAWGNEYSIETKISAFDAARFQVDVKNSKNIVVESFQNLSMNTNDRRFVTSVINHDSQLIDAAVTGAGTTPANTVAPVPLLLGDDGTVLQPDDPAFEAKLFPLAGDAGVFYLDRVDLFNLLCVPGETKPSQLSKLEAFCQARRAFLIADSANGGKFGDYSGTGPDGALTGDSSTNAAFYFPWVMAPNPLKENKPEAYPPCGFIAGLFARTDTNRGVWKAPAGTEASLVGVTGVTEPLTDIENGVLNPKAINCIRTFPVYGTIVWGARTLQGNDQVGSEWKYIPVRRTALFIEETLYRSSKWMVFEPNDEPLWSQIRMNIGAFMQDMFRQGAFQGKTPKEAYFVKCDKETTTQSDINNGIVNIIVGFAPLKPAEFVIIKIQQMAGQIQS